MAGMYKLFTADRGPGLDRRKSLAIYHRWYLLRAENGLLTRTLDWTHGILVKHFHAIIKINSNDATG